MSVKLFVFDSVEEAWVFEHPEEIRKVVEGAREARKTDALDEKPVEQFPAEEPQKPKKYKFGVRKQDRPKKLTNGTGKRLKIDHELLTSLVPRFESGEISAAEAADELGCNIQAFYNAKNRLAKKGGKKEAPISLTGQDLHAAIQGLKEDGLSSVQIAQRLKITLKVVNENW